MEFARDRVAAVESTPRDRFELESKEWANALVKSEWLEQIHQLLYCAYEVANLMHAGNATIVVHDAEGSDTALIITSLVHIILDPDARSLLG